ncbi:DUF6572 domain-containing protein [Photorhabdus heterorhabditis]|uniref:DUF6572 domain-containing protein n=1 Tax=Photorhabdus heterorhabditis TaxID=880156 RepID=UPI001BD5615C|nr:DUF6572 domain-containing protein [Photorhabdus heterorhabditis]MBS9444416.1 hypothetical protein [Photorhabdus heterorhabditis]
MSIEDVNKIDMIGIPNNNENLVVLGLTDHLPWSGSIEEHLLKLQEKINSYIRFIESGEIYESFPASCGKSEMLIEVYFKYHMPHECADFLEKVGEILAPVNIQLRYEEGDIA